MDYKVDHGHFYIVYKNQDPEKAILIDDFIQIDDIKLLEQFTLEMINCKFDFYKIDGTPYIEDYTLLNRACVYADIKKINYLIERGADLMHEYKHYKHIEPINCIRDLQHYLTSLEYGKEDRKWYERNNYVIDIKLLINKIKHYEEDIKKPNKLCRNI
jgi:hypothetical protein